MAGSEVRAALVAPVVKADTAPLPARARLTAGVAQATAAQEDAAATVVRVALVDAGAMAGRLLSSLTMPTRPPSPGCCWWIFHPAKVARADPVVQGAQVALADQEGLTPGLGVQVQATLEVQGQGATTALKGRPATPAMLATTTSAVSVQATSEPSSGSGPNDTCVAAARG